MSKKVIQWRQSWHWIVIAVILLIAYALTRTDMLGIGAMIAVVLAKLSDLQDEIKKLEVSFIDVREFQVTLIRGIEKLALKRQGKKDGSV